MIYVNLVGRIGNQLFQYAMAESLRQKRGGNEKIVFCDYGIRSLNWENSLEFYNLPNVEYQHTKFPRNILVFCQKSIASFFYKIRRKKSYNEIFEDEKKYKKFLNFFGIVLCQNGYIHSLYSKNVYIYISGYFQSEKYFFLFKDYIVNNLTFELDARASYFAEIVKNRNTVCISIKVEHNIGSSLYDVCNNDYYLNAINYVAENVSDPLFFICSDNVTYVLDNLIDANKYDCICQDKSLSVTETLALMGLCKHFILSNTSFGWWGQYLSLYDKKIVVAPNKWMRIDMPIDIYGQNWLLIDVDEYINMDK